MDGVLKMNVGGKIRDNKEAFVKIKRAADINYDFLKNYELIKDEFPEIEIFVEANAEEFLAVIDFYKSDEPISEYTFEQIKNGLKSIHYFSQSLIEEGESLDAIELHAIAQEKALILELEDWNIFPIERF